MSRWPSCTIPERFWSKAARTDIGCWEWEGTHISTGYGEFHIRPGERSLAHRFAYELEVGPIPEGLVIDHLCSNPNCVRPDHLEAVTMWENTLRGRSHVADNPEKTRCKNGHPYDEANTYYNSKGWRFCRICHREHSRKTKARSA